MFLVNVPVIAVALLAGWPLVRESKDPASEPLDPVGAALSIAGLVSLVYAIIEAPGRGWSDPVIVAAFAAAAVLLVAFVVWELRVAHPMLDMGFFRDPRFSAASGAITLVFFALFGSIFLLTQHLQFVLGYSPLEAGVRILPIAALIVTAPVSARVVEHVGTKLVVAAGLLVVAGGLGLLSTVGIDDGYGLVAASLAVLGTGMGLTMAPATESIMGALPLAKAGVGSAMNDTTRKVGGALGVAVLGSVLAGTLSQRDRAGGRGPAGTGRHRRCGLHRRGDRRGGTGRHGRRAAARGRARRVRGRHGRRRAGRGGRGAPGRGAGPGLPARAARSDRRRGRAGPCRAGGGDHRVTARSPGRPRSAEAHRAILDAALDLFVEQGWHAMSVEGVAARAGVGKATVYRRWRSKEELIADAVAELVFEAELPDHGSVRADLEALLGAMQAALSATRAGEVFPRMAAEIAAGSSLGRTYLARVVAPRVAILRQVLERGMARGELRADLNPDVALGLLVGPLIVWRLTGGLGGAAPGDAAAVVDTALRGLLGSGALQVEGRGVGDRGADAEKARDPGARPAVLS